MSYLGRHSALAGLTSSDIPDNSITSAKIVDGAVAVADIGTNAVGADELANDAVDTNAIADDAITGGKLANDIAISTSGAITTTNTITSGDGSTDQYIDLKKGNSDKHGIIRFYRESGVDWSIGESSGESGDPYLVGGGTDFGIWQGSSPSAKLVVKTDGKVGIGTASPTYALDIEDSIAGGWVVEINNTHTGSGGGLLINNANASPGGQELLRINNQGNTKFEIHADGNVCIGTSTSNGRLNITQTSGSRHITTKSYSTASHNHHVFENNSGTNVGSCTVSTSGTAFNTSSDYRLKENIVAMTNAISRLKNLKPSRFNFKINPDTTFDGFIAHEACEVVPEAVTGEKDAMTEAVLYVEGDELPEGKSVGDVKEAEKIDPQGIDQSKLVPLLVGALQEAITRIEALENA